MNKLYILFQGFGQTINDWNKKTTNFLSKLRLYDEINKLQKLNNDNYNYYLFVNASHMIYLDKNAVNSILEKI